MKELLNSIQKGSKVKESDIGIRITIPGLPPSVNHYVKHSRGRHYKTEEAARFQQDIAVMANGRKVCAATYKIVIEISLGPKRKGDIDNFAKVCLDGLVKAGVIHSDSAVTHLLIRKARGLESFTCIQVEGI